MTEQNILERSWMERDDLQTGLQAVSLYLLLFPVAILAFAVLGFAFHWRLTAWYLLPAAMITAFFVRFVCRSWRITGIAAIVTVAIHVGALFLSLNFFDGSWDGLSYHQEAVIRLAEGWNPVYENAEKYGKLWHHTHVEDFPKGTWIAAATIFRATGRIEAGKLFQLTLILAAGCQVAAALLRLTSLPVLTIAVLSMLAAANPVAICQSTTFLVDGMIATGLTLLIGSLSVYIATLQWRFFVPVFVATAFVINGKFNGVVFSVMILGGASMFVFWRHGLHAFIKMAAAATVTMCVSILLLGYAPYARNLKYQGELFYPFQGAQAEKYGQILRNQLPDNLLNEDRFTRFVIAQFSRAENVPFSSRTSHLKFPLSLSVKEARAYGRNDLRIGAFGPFFGAMLLGSLVIAILLLANSSFRTRFSVMWVCCAMILLTMFVHQQGWYARFTPQTWLLPILFITAGLSTPSRSVRLLANAILVVAALNVLIVGGAYLHVQRAYSMKMKRSLQEMSLAQPPVKVYVREFFSIRRRFQEAGIQFVFLPGVFVKQDDEIEIIGPDVSPTEVAAGHKIPGFGSMFWLEK